MTNSNSDDRHRQEISHLRAQNRRYRELIQNLSSMVDILRNRTEHRRDSARELHAFENFAVESGQRPDLFQLDHGATGASRRNVESAQERASIDIKPLVPNPGWKCLSVDLPQMRIGFTLFGMTPQAIDEAVEVVEQRQVRSRDFTPVFVTDDTNLAPFRVRGYVVEYIPTRVTLGDRNNSFERQYLSARLELIRMKWGLGEFVDLGKSLRE